MRDGDTKGGNNIEGIVGVETKHLATLDREMRG